MIIAVSGKLGSGKDTVGKIIQYLIWENNQQSKHTILPYTKIDKVTLDECCYLSKWSIKKFADKLKDTVCLWTGCTREQLEDQEFKDREIGPDWVRYAVAIGHGTRDGQRIMWSNTCTKEEYEEELRVNWQTAYKKNLTYRDLLQLLGTECMRNTIHINGWVNSLMSEYKPTCINYCGRMKHVDDEGCSGTHDCDCLPDWIITDLRFPNELEAIKDREGITIRVNRPKPECTCLVGETEDCTTKCTRTVNFEHESEKALDDAKFDYTISNDGTIENLVEKVREILIKERVI